ncbi:ABC transporter ATP-binding protein [Granulicella sp. L60]|uniref:ABC transporter ATP-binding protein n=1 Tax=Granulicella sp. L60 TaxID=1641866 RepID=UPI00131D5C97|nr:ABC transporter ATP-binding protein [Granulicella sp. L60]
MSQMMDMLGGLMSTEQANLQVKPRCKAMSNSSYLGQLQRGQNWMRIREQIPFTLFCGRSMAIWPCHLVMVTGVRTLIQLCADERGMVLKSMPVLSPSRVQNMSLLRKLPKLAREVWQSSPVLTILIVPLRMLGAPLPVALLAVAGAILDSINRVQRYGGSLHKLWLLLALEAGLVVANDLISRCSSHCDTLISDRFSLHLNLRLMQHCADLDLENFESPAFQDRLERARTQASSQVALLRTLLQIGQQTVGVVGMIASAFVLAPGLIAIQLIGVFPVVFAESYFAKYRYTLNRSRTAVRRLMEYLLILGTSSAVAKELKLFRLGGHIREQYRSIGEKYNREDAELSGKQMYIGVALMGLGTAVYYAAYGVLLYRAAHGGLSIGRLVFLSGILQRTKSQLSGLFSGISRTLDQLMYLGDVFELFGETSRIQRPRDPKVFPVSIQSGIEFRHVSFAYAGSSKWALRDVSFRIAPGERIALVGENGAGKTTVIKLLTRLYDPTEGQILIDGTDLREFAPEDLRGAVTAVFQDFVHYDLSVKDNIGFGNIDRLSDLDSIARAAKEARAASVIENLPRRYDQILGKRFDEGMELSGGQWQKLALARAYMRDAAVVVLDEPTAAIDARAEAALFHDFAEMMTGKIALLISHRFSTVRIADRILVLEGGMIREQGSHEELLAADGEYAQLFELQAAGYR